MSLKRHPPSTVDPPAPSGTPQPAEAAPAASAPIAPRARSRRQLPRRFVAGVRRQAGQLAHAWQSSLQLRVGAITVLVTGIVVLVIGVFLVDQVSGGILRAKRDAAKYQANIGLPAARSALSTVDAGVVGDVSAAQQQITQMLTASGRSAGLFTIAIESSASGSSTGVEGASVAIPDGLRRTVREGNLALQYAPVPASADSDHQVRGLIVGAPVSARTGLFELYYLFPLTTEQRTIELLQRTAWLSGLALVVLVLAITLLLTRLVVRPVRVAAQTASRLAAGELSQRITVRGHDDLARLGRSFNDMAGSLQRQIGRLEELSRLQRRFTSDVSHELRTPLTTIRMAAELLHGEREQFPPELARAAELLHDELDRFEALLAELLEISRYDAGVASLEAERVDLRGAVTAAVDMNRVLAQRQGSELVVRMPESAITVEMDSRRVERILRNLVANAIDHGQGEPVEITVGYDEEAVAVTVRDHGVGLRAGEAGLVFNRFWRGDQSRSRLTGGTGLGLAISLEDARLHGGWLQAWGEPGRGAQFRLTLPRHAGDTLTTAPLPLAPESADEDDEP